MKRILLILFFMPFLSLYAPNLSKECIEAQKERKFIREEKIRLFNLVIEEIKKGETFSTITKEKAEELLIQDFNEVHNYLDGALPWNKRLAIAKFCFNIGIGNYNKSRLKEYVDNNKPIDNLIIKYCYYKKNGQYIKSDWLLKQRKFELNIYNYGI